ncbi:MULTISPECIES: hypothetical protein [Pseudonocardia]|uniref:Uncharacterized protein n=2 Tax=Pseudonocardia TaxID=1847 RepID=A0A1Y2MHS3_PSEAH|nr:MULTISPECIES: hypothetical protein [Pseudonocardia]OSY34816.1 hypothetical protein BG845_06502 [Pseudonocardia autotrophica]TDN73027.1 hypothetical protein C8E95_2098 [Pseudonocardia autotrophica]BBG03746.1 hypothetical protein Pdca_49550 [Pseudonocardia autotrophica]GEC26647.1 hypothetical protein PSA01_36760 [Pseudonocardia saturnea]
MTTTEGKKATYKKRYEEGDDGLRFQDLTYTGNFVGLEPVTDGIKGDKMLKARAKSGVLEKVSKDDVLNGQFSIDELNDLNNYLAWNIWDVLVMRATEGVSGMIPRQEYEILAFMHEFYRWPEILRMTTNEVGPQGVMDIGASARREIGTKVNSVHDWCIGAVGFGMGRCGLLALEAIGPDDYVAESNEILKFMQRVLWGKRQDGYILNSQDRYRCRIHEEDFLEQLTAQVETLEPGSPKHGAFTQFNAATELLAFLHHYDNRLGLGDTGPYELPDGNLLILRDLFVNEEIYHWSDVSEDAKLPHAYTLAMIIDPEKMGLEEIRVNDISTTFTRPKNYIEAIIGGAVFAREKWDTPMGEVYPIKIDELGDHLGRVQQATLKLYTKTSKMCRRDLIWNGQYVYYIDMILPHLRKAGTYEKACRDYDLWEIDQRVSNYYYDITKRGFAQETVPSKIFSGAGYLPFSENADLRSSKGRWL